MALAMAIAMAIAMALALALAMALAMALALALAKYAANTPAARKNLKTGGNRLHWLRRSSLLLGNF